MFVPSTSSSTKISSPNYHNHNNNNSHSSSSGTILQPANNIRSTAPSPAPTQPTQQPQLSLQDPLTKRTAQMSDNGGNSPRGGDEPKEPPQQTEHLNIKVTDNNNEVFFKIKRTTALKKLMDAFCERQGKAPTSVRFLFDGARVQPTDSPDSLDMADGDTLEVHQEQIGGGLYDEEV